MTQQFFRPDRGVGVGGAIAGVFVIGFGVLWTILAFVITADAPFPMVHVVFPLFGVLFVIGGIVAMAASVASVAQVNRVGTIETPKVNIESTPPAAESPKPRSLVHCECGEPFRVGGRFCTRCGKPVGGPHS